MNTVQLSIRANEEQQDILVSTLNEMGATGFEQQEGLLLAYFPENNFNSYEVNDALNGYEFNIQTIEEQNWNAIWESNFSPVIIEDFCAIRADFHDPIREVEHEIIITPKMSFGTGHHATTYMMVRHMRDLDLNGKNIFDFGTGTGILAILAEKLGAGKVSAIDVDEWSIINAQENTEKNNCTRITLELGTQLPSDQFDIILANINRNVILQYLPEIKRIIKPGGQLLLSGLLISDDADIIEACKDELVLTGRDERNNWLSLLFKRVTNNH